MFLRIIGVTGVALLISCATGASKDKPAAGKPRKVDFVREIQPILEKWQLAVQGNFAHIMVMPHVTRKKIDELTADIASNPS